MRLRGEPLVSGLPAPPNILCDGPTLWFSEPVHSSLPQSGSLVRACQWSGKRGTQLAGWTLVHLVGLCLTRNIPVREGQAVQIRAELFNPFNQTHRDGDGYWPNMQLVSGIVPAGSGASSTFADFSTSLHGGRTVRMLLKYSF